MYNTLGKQGQPPVPRGCKVAVTGKMRSGKDSFSEAFIESCFTELKFADGIADVIDDNFPDVVARGDKKPRKHFQIIGQAFRQLDEDIWIKQLENRMSLLPKHADIIITDARQANEIEWLKENGFTIIKVVASQETRKQRILQAGDIFKDELFEHETEKAVDLVEADFTVLNEGTLEDLHKQAYKFIHDYFKRGA